ncbi:MAG: uncharacterized protein JWR10_81 [Rubritepida sp.]|nr:uncharacterized protein [Rubritepida sp.]
MVRKPASAPLFGVIERLQGDLPWGSLLDAGTGVKSALWASGLATERWTGVTADSGHHAETQAALGKALRPQDRLIAGNWTDPALLAGEVHDTVLAEYLLGAVEGFAPYFQESLFARLRPLVGGRLYVVGLDPYLAGRAEDEAGRMVQAIGCFRDGCSLLAGETPYREFPAEWVLDRLRQAGFQILSAQRFSNRYPMEWVELQLATSRTLLARIADRDLARALLAQALRLRQEATALIGRQGPMACGSDYVVSAA